MDLASLFLVLIGLSAGAFLSAFSFGREAKKKEVPGRALICGSVFGVFEGFMPLVGFLAASLLGNTLGRFAHWVGFLLLSYLGLSLLIETLRRRRKAATPTAGWELKGLLLAALSASVDLLVAADVVEPRYYQAILDGVAEHGPYFVIAPGLAMPHGRPEEGVKKTGFALVTLKKPLIFNHEDNDPVDILITMAAVDATTHQEVGIMQIVNLFDDEANFDRLRACRSEQEVLDLIKNATAAAV